MSAPRIRTRARVGFVLAALAATGCSSPAATASPASTASPAPTASSASAASSAPATQTAEATAQPVCGTQEPPIWVTDRAPQPGDGKPDPAGRIVFGVIVRNDIGQVVRPLMGIDPDASDLRQVLDCELSRPRFSRDGDQLAFGVVMDSGIWQLGIADPDGSSLDVIRTDPATTEIDKYGHPDWSPDGTWLAFGLNAQIWRIDVDGSNARLLGAPDKFDSEPRISPDGRSVLFLRGDFAKGISEPWIRDLETGQERSVLADNHRELEHAEWSPDGKWIVYNTLTDLTGEHVEQIERMAVDDPSATPTVLYAPPGEFVYKPVYSPDGAWIAFGCGGLCVMAADGSKEQTLFDTGGAGEINHIAWGLTPP